MADASNDPELLNAAGAGNISQFRAQLLEDPGLDTIHLTSDRYGNINELVTAAIEARQVKTLSWLLNERFPAWNSSYHNHVEALQAGPAIGDVYYARFPHLIE